MVDTASQRDEIAEQHEDGRTRRRRATAGAGAPPTHLMWAAVLPPDSDPFLDDHLVQGAVLIVPALVGTGNTLGLGRAWQNPMVSEYSFGWSPALYEGEDMSTITEKVLTETVAEVTSPSDKPVVISQEPPRAA